MISKKWKQIHVQYGDQELLNMEGWAYHKMVTLPEGSEYGVFEDNIMIFGGLSAQNLPNSDIYLLPYKKEIKKVTKLNMKGR